MSTWREFTDYAPGGGISRKGRRRRAAQKAGRASGRSRRQTAWQRRGNTGYPGPKLELDYEARRPSRAEFDARYRKHWPEPQSAQGAASWTRGRETVWAHLMASWRLLAVEGQHCKTSKPQRARALEKAGRPRCERTVRRANQRLDQMGLAGFAHHRAPKGRKDCLVLEWRLSRRLRTIDVTPPSGTVNPGLRPGGLPPSDTIPPAAPAENEGAEPPPAPPDEPYVPVLLETAITEEEERARSARFEAMWAQAKANRGSARARGADSGRGCNAR